MKIAINARLLRAPDQNGWNRYLVNLLAELPALGVRPYLYSDQPLHPDHLTRLPADAFEVRIKTGLRYLDWEQRWVPSQCARDRVDAWHCPINFGVPWFSPCPRILTLHDAIFQRQYVHAGPFSFRRWCAGLRPRFAHWVAHARSEVILTMSEYSRQDLIHYLKIPERKIRCVYGAAEGSFHAAVSDEARVHARGRYGLERPYVFYIGNYLDHKNVPFLVRAFARSGLASQTDLVMAGGMTDLQAAALHALAKELEITTAVRMIGRVDDTDLPALYADAECFAYPSRHEGFGLQLCEAMAVGCPVIASRASCFPEILGDGGEMFPLDDPQPAADLIRRVVVDRDFRAGLIQRSHKRGTDFSWRLTALSTVDAYRDVSEKRPSGSR